MNNFQSDSDSIQKCKDKGFINLDWEENIIDLITGQLTDRARLEGENFCIYIVIGHTKFAFTYQYSVSVSFEYGTDLGTLNYFMDYRNPTFDNTHAREYGQWQATLLYKIFSAVDSGKLIGKLDNNSTNE